MVGQVWLARHFFWRCNVTPNWLAHSLVLRPHPMIEVQWLNGIQKVVGLNPSPLIDIVLFQQNHHYSCHLHHECYNDYSKWPRTFICIIIVYCDHTYFEYILSLSVNQGLLNGFLKMQDISQEKRQNRSLLLITLIAIWVMICGFPETCEANQKLHI